MKKKREEEKKKRKKKKNGKGMDAMMILYGLYGCYDDFVWIVIETDLHMII